MRSLLFPLLAACAGTVSTDADTDADTTDDTDADTDTSDTDPADDTDADPAACWEAATLLDVSAGPGPDEGGLMPELSGTCTPTTFTVRSNAVPHYTFVPITPNALVEGDYTWALPRSPSPAATTTAIPLLGTIAFAVNGGPIFGPNEGAQPANTAFGDPVYNGIMDGCLGHTAFAYHFHALVQACLVASGLVAQPWTLPAADPSTPSPILGWALDGFPIYGPHGCLDEACTDVVTFESGYAQTGDPTQDAWDAYAWSEHDDDVHLDACNGRVGPDGTYRYHATATFPYVLGCYRGEPVAGGDAPGGGGPPGGPR